MQFKLFLEILYLTQPAQKAGFFIGKNMSKGIYKSIYENSADLGSATGLLDASKIATGIVSNTEFNYLNNVSSAIQTQLDAKQATLTAANFGSFNNGLTAKTTPVDADEINIVDSAASNVQNKVTWVNIKATLKTYFDTLYQSTITFGTGALTALGVNVGSAGAVVVNGGALGTPSSGTLTNCTGYPATALPAGSTVQVVNTQTGAVATGTTVLPNDDTIPQNTEGDEYMTLAITPTNASNKLRIEVVVQCSGSLLALAAMALFQDSTANALAAAAQSNGGASYNEILVLS